MKIKDVPYYEKLKQHMQRTVAFAIEEDVEEGDITAQLIPEDQYSSASIVCKETAIVCGTEWVDEAFYQVDPSVKLTWHVKDGDVLDDGTNLVDISGNSRSILTAERTALNFLQTLSGTATSSRAYAQAAEGTGVIVLDTRKTIPGLRLAQKYAVKVGGCENHRLGLYDMFLVKENHIAAAGGIHQAVKLCNQIAPKAKIEIEVEDHQQLDEAVLELPDYIMLDDWQENVEKLELKQRDKIMYEISGSLDLKKLQHLHFGQPVRASVGLLTKAVRPVDFSLRVYTIPK